MLILDIYVWITWKVQVIETDLGGFPTYLGEGIKSSVVRSANVVMTMDVISVYVRYVYLKSMIMYSE